MRKVNFERIYNHFHDGDLFYHYNGEGYSSLERLAEAITGDFGDLESEECWRDVVFVGINEDADGREYTLYQMIDELGA